MELLPTITSDGSAGGDSDGEDGGESESEMEVVVRLSGPGEQESEEMRGGGLN